MKTFTTIIALLLTGQSFAGNSAYEQAMEAALSQFATSKSVEDMQSTANSFQRIAKFADAEWLPEYYQAHCYVLMSFMIKDGAQKDAYLDVAEKSITKVLELQPTNTEAYALQAFLYTGRLVVDPMTRGREYSIKSHESLKKALAINPTNPRALYLQLTNEIGTANFFGTDTSIFCERIETLQTNWDSYNQVADMNPSWGKNQAQNLKADCNN